MKGASVNYKGEIDKAVVDLLKKGLEKGVFDAVLVPLKVPAGDSFAYVLAKSGDLLEDAAPLPPVMAVQGARAISRLTRRGKGSMKIAAVIRPCEVRATYELAKLTQVDLDNITLISIDCPGAIPLKDYLEDPEKGNKTFSDAANKWDSGPMREVCKGCGFGTSALGDLHIGTVGGKKGTFMLVPNTDRGKKALEELDLKADKALDGWEKESEKIAEKRGKQKEKMFKELRAEYTGLDGVLDAFGKCINCHNCMRVCPICYCQQCFFESDTVKQPSQDYVERAVGSGSMRLPPDTIMFHIGRMIHMSLSCVGCGMCEDACPMSIPVSRIFNMVGSDTQSNFDYVPGENKDEPLPMVTFKEEEFQEIGE